MQIINDFKLLSRWFFLKKILKEKIKLLREVELDKKFLIECKDAENLLSKVQDLRKQLKDEQGKEEGKKDYTKINEISFEIALTEKTMRDYTTTSETIKDLVSYISMIQEELELL